MAAKRSSRGKNFDNVKNRYPTNDTCNKPHQCVQAISREPEGNGIEQMSRAAGQDEAGKKKISPHKLGIGAAGNVFKNGKRYGKIGRPNQQVTNNVKPAMKLAPIAA